MTTRKVRWPAEGGYGEAEIEAVRMFLRSHPMIAVGGTGKWTCTIPEGVYEVWERGGRYLAYFVPVVGTKEVISAATHVGHKDDAWARTVLAVMHDADRRGAVGYAGDRERRSA
jgi:hypothetical protein